MFTYLLSILTAYLALQVSQAPVRLANQVNDAMWASDPHYIGAKTYAKAKLECDIGKVKWLAVECYAESFDNENVDSLFQDIHKEIFSRTEKTALARLCYSKFSDEECSEEYVRKLILVKRRL